MSWLRGRSAEALQHALEQNSHSGDHGQRELLDLVAELSAIGPGEPLDPTFRAETRQRLLAMAEQHQATPAPSTPAVSTPVPRPAFRPVQPRLRRLSVAVAVVAALVAVAGLLNVASRDALPGDSLYAVKRGSEQVQLALTFDPLERGYALLRLAETRLDEVSVLVEDSPAAGVVAALADMDRRTREGIALLTGTAVDAADRATLDVLPVWAAGQTELLGGLTEKMTTREQDRAKDSLALLDQVGERARSLGEALPCECLDAEPTDELGPLPCVSCAPRSSGSPPPGGGAPPTS